MSKNGPRAYCSIANFLEDRYPDYYALMRSTCTLSSLGKSRNGLTLVIPPQSLIDEIAELAQSEDPAKLQLASDTINSMIFVGEYKTPAAFFANKSDLPNNMYPKQHVEIDKVTDKQVLFKSGAKIEVDPTFIDGSKQSKLAVWKLVGGKLPITKDKNATLANIKKKKAGPTGGFTPSERLVQQQRFRMIVAIENEYALSRQHGGTDPYFHSLLSLVNYVLNVRMDRKLFCERMLPLISYDQIDLYILIDPFRTSGEYLLDDALLADWWRVRQFTAFSYRAVMTQVERILESGGASDEHALVYTGRKQVFDALLRTRKQICQSVDAAPRLCVGGIVDYYRKFEQTGVIPGTSEQLYPSALTNWYRSQPMLKMVHDELRYLSYIQFRSLESGVFDAGAFITLQNFIAECLSLNTPEERARACKLLNDVHIRQSVAPAEEVGEVKMFVYSTMFMYIPATRAESRNVAAKYSARRPDPDRLQLWNIGASLSSRVNRLLQLEPEHSVAEVDGPDSHLNIADLLRGLDVKTLSPDLAQILRDKLTA
jgi:hypothetical protein